MKLPSRLARPVFVVAVGVTFLVLLSIGAKIVRSERNFRRTSWEFNRPWIAGYEWNFNAYIKSCSVGDGVLRLHVVGRDPCVWSSRIRTDKSRINRMVLRMKITFAETDAGKSNHLFGQVYWMTTRGGGFSDKRYVNFPVIADGEFREYTIDLGRKWHETPGKLSSLRLDPVQQRSATLPEMWVEVDYIRLVR